MNASRRTHPVNNNAVGNSDYGHEDRPTIEYPNVRPGDPPLREVERKVFQKDQYDVGWIIRAPLHEEDYQDGADYQTIPLYTHNDEGLERKANQDEFVYVHDKYRVSRQPLNQRKNGHLDAAIDLQTRIPLYRPKSAAHLNYIVARNYSLKVEYQGHLTKDSVKKLLDITKPHLTNKLTFKV